MLKCSSCIGLKHRKVWIAFRFFYFCYIYEHGTALQNPQEYFIHYSFLFNFYTSALLVWWINRWINETIIFGLSVERVGVTYIAAYCPCWSMCWTIFFSSILFFPYCIPCPYASLFLILYLFARGETMHRDITASQYKALSFIFDSFWNTFRYDSFKTFLHVSV